MSIGALAAAGAAVGIAAVAYLAGFLRIVTRHAPAALVVDLDGLFDILDTED